VANFAGSHTCRPQIGGAGAGSAAAARICRSTESQHTGDGGGAAVACSEGLTETSAAGETIGKMPSVSRHGRR
jgi:hypothetical protein